MLALLRSVAELDRSLLEAVQTLHWAPATALFVVALAWWVKGPLFLPLGGLADVRARRRFPLTAICVGVSFVSACTVSALLKDAFDRARPETADPSLVPLVATPTNASFPSGHALTAFATAVAVSMLHPRLRWPALAVAALVALSRVYLGVHYALDVVAGAALGAAVGLAVVRLARFLLSRRAQVAVP